MKPQAVLQNMRSFEWRKFFSQPIFQDRISQIAIIFSIVLTIGTVAVLAVNIRPSEYPVPIHYANHIGFDRMGPWYLNYSLGFFTIGATTANLLLAAKSFRRNRVASFFLLLGSVVISLFSLVVSLAFARVV